MTLTKKAELYVENLLKDNLSELYSYHNLQHTKQVVSYLTEMGKYYNLSEEENLVLQLAGWFHDTGFIKGAELHENHSCQIFERFAKEENLDQKTIDDTKLLIMATNITLTPKKLLEQIIRDADCAHFGSCDYNEISERLRKEWEITQNKTLTDQQWLEGNRLAFTTWHRFHTDYAQKNWQKQKELNLELLNQKLENINSQSEEKSEKKKKKGERGVETLFRVTLNNHTQLSQIADSKANILLSVNAILISIALSTLVPKLDSANNAHLIIPTCILVFFSVISIVFAILSTRPKLHDYKYKEGDLETRKVNLLFFGNFNQIPMDQYVNAMEDLMKEPDYLYQSLIKDLYYLGKVLDRKYKLLRITYNVFMFGIIISVIFFGIAIFRL